MDLPRSEQLAAFEEIREYLGQDVGIETDVDRLIEREQEALSVLRRVADDLRERGALGPDRAPTADQFDAVAKRLGLTWDRSRVVRVFGLWRNAKRSLLDQHVTQGRAQRRFRHKTAGRRRSHEECLTAVRGWLGSKPEGLQRLDYDSWAEKENRKRGDDERPLPMAEAIRSRLGFPWSDVVKVAQGTIELSAALKRQARRVLRGRSDDDLVGAAAVQALLGTPTQHVPSLLARPDFPRPVTRIGRTRAWVLGDLKAYGDGRPAPKRSENEFQDKVLDSSQVARRLGLRQDSVLRLIHEKRWDRLPQPDGQVGAHHYWWRDGFEDGFTDRSSHT